MPIKKVNLTKEYESPPKKIDNFPKMSKPSNKFPHFIFSKKKPKSRTFDECAVLNNIYRWKQKVEYVIPENKYHIFQTIFKLPPADHEEGPERDYSLYNYVPRKSLMRLSSTRTSSTDESSLTFLGITRYEPRTVSVRSKQEEAVPKEVTSGEFARKELNLKVPERFRKECRLMKWKLAGWKVLHALQAFQGKVDGDYDDLFVNPPTEPPTPPKDILQDIRSPYQKFLSKSNDEVASTWRTQKKSIPIEQLDLEDQAKVAADMIAKEFIQWMREKAGFTDSLLTESLLKEMFQVDLKDQTLRTMKVEIRELASVPDSIAKFYDVPWMNERAALHRQIIWDSMNEKVPERAIGFGQRHPKPNKKPKTNAKEKWFNTEIIPPELQSGALLWQKLIGTPVLEKFCQWLLENPQYSKPSYLVSCGYLDEVAKKLKAKSHGYTFAEMAAKRKKVYMFNGNVYRDKNEKISLTVNKITETDKNKLLL